MGLHSRLKIRLRCLPGRTGGGNLTGMRGGGRQMRAERGSLRVLAAGLCWWLCAGVAPVSVEAEIVQRDLGKNDKGQTVSGYVFQPGRSNRRRPRSSNSVFGGRRDYYRRGRGIDYGYGYPVYASSFYYYVPRTYSYPIHHHYRGGGSLSVYVSF